MLPRADVRLEGFRCFGFPRDDQPGIARRRDAMESLTDALRNWHDLFMLFGSASTTMIGLLFVAASVSSGVFNQAKQGALRAFLSPSVVHFSCVLTASLLAISPLSSWMLMGVLIGCTGLFGVLYAGFVCWRMVQNGYRVDLEDRAYYAALPVVGHVIMVAAGLTFLAQIPSGCAVLAIAMGLLMVVSIRNAWDITTWSVIQRPD
jgi:hypothetical protein